MSKYFDHVTQQLYSKIKQAKVYINRHNPTTGALAEAILRQFLQEHLPKAVSVEQGFIVDQNGELSRQCDILIYDSQRYAPFYRAEGIVVVQAEAVIAIVEVKTSINKSGFSDVIKYFKSFDKFDCVFNTYLFIFDAPRLSTLSSWFDSYKHPGDYQHFDHDTYQFLPDEITGLGSSYHLKKDYVITDRDEMGYLSYFFSDNGGDAISSLELFFISIYSLVENHIQQKSNTKLAARSDFLKSKASRSISAISLFRM